MIFLNQQRKETLNQKTPNRYNPKFVITKRVMKLLKNERMSYALPGQIKLGEGLHFYHGNFLLEHVDLLQRCLGLPEANINSLVFAKIH